MEAATTRFYRAMSRGDLTSFFSLLSEDPSIIEQCIIECSSRLMHSPLHVAASVGNFVMVQTLLYMNPSMCLARDQDGRTPIHVAASKGHVDVIQVLHHENCCAALEKTHYDESILHLCVKFRKLDALKILLELTDDNGDVLLNSKDKYGNTILHLAVATKQPQMVEFLISNTKIERNAVNKFEMTAVDIHLMQSRKGKGDGSIENSLIKAKAKIAEDIWNQESNKKWLEDQRSALMVVASLIANMAFQAGINPSGGVWEETKKNQLVDVSSTKQDIFAGTAIWSYFQYETYDIVQISNAISLVLSMTVTLTLISDFPYTRHFFAVPVLRVTLWVSVASIVFSYMSSVTDLTGGPRGTSVIGVALYLLKVFCGFVGIMHLVYVTSFLFSMTVAWKVRESIKRFLKNIYTVRD